MAKQQFDELLGGDQKLPNGVHILKFLSARGSEIAYLTNELENPQQTKRIFQKLPMQMRRRVMSHNVKRLPRKLRDIHSRQMAKSGLPPKTKTPSRKHRRRPRNLLTEYNRRQRNKFWIETHIWHAKRFKMEDAYGFKIPFHSNDRCFRANYRAIKQHCLLQDISYYTCVELKGKRSHLLKILLDHCSTNSMSFAAKMYENGEKEGSLMFYRFQSYPEGPIGNIYFLWSPVNNSATSSTQPDDIERTIWIWIHPAFYNDIMKELISSFNFVIQNEGNENIKELEAELRQKEWNDLKAMPPMLELLKTVKTPVYCNDEGCQMTILKNSLNRFRLRGPLALDVITDALRCPKLESVTKEEVETPDVQIKDNFDVELWFEEYYKLKSNKMALEVQRKTLNSITNLTPGQLLPYMVLGLTVLDPRFYLPQKREKVYSNLRQQKRLIEYPEMANNSALWSKDLRDVASEQFVASGEINKLRSGRLVPGVQNDILFGEDVMRKIPIILIQKTGTTGRSLMNNKSNGFASGVDIILPSNWSMAFWLAFILRCAKPAGSRDAMMTCFESENLISPEYHEPDMPIYKMQAALKKQELTEQYFRRPPKKRVNFIKLKVSEPFFCNWDLLMKEWTGTTQYLVYRDHRILKLLQGCLAGLKKMQMSTNLNAEDFNNYLIPVKVSLINGGTPKDFALICIPQPEDLQMFINNKKWIGVQQKQYRDPFEKQRAQLRMKHCMFLRKLKRQRITGCKKIKEMDLHPEVIQRMMRSIQIQSLDKAKEHIIKQAALMANMYLPKTESVRYQGDRETFGFVSHGAYSYSSAKGVGVGYVVAKVLIQMINEKQRYVLVRNTTSKMFRIAKIDIVN